MHVWHDVAEVDAGLNSTIVTIGNYDGVHVGHQHLIQHACAVARERGGIPLIVVTFDPHPLVVIAPDVAPQALTSLDRRIALLGEAGADAVLVLRFTPEMAAVSAENFALRVLLDGLRAEAIVVGENFRFGHRALGNVEMLRSLCASRGVDVVAIPLDGAHGQTWSSSYIRSSIANGDVTRRRRGTRP
ncbi:MAG: adenylyltransferase/cytidyltransferase family protein [Nocardioidaceae bacterium]